MSLPSRERGLKYYLLFQSDFGRMSLPSRERGLKCQGLGESLAETKSLPSRERGLKSFSGDQYYRAMRVAPLAGAWIEMQFKALFFQGFHSRSPRGSVD